MVKCSSVVDVCSPLTSDFSRAQDLPTVVCDSGDLTSLEALAVRTKVVLTTVGPYTKYGAKLVEACANSGTHYVDLTGETLWMYDMIDRFGEKAKATGAKIVHTCGFDSEPSDLGALMMYRHLDSLGATPTEIKYMLGPSMGGFSGGTVHSLAEVMLEAIKNRRFKQLQNPYLLVPKVCRVTDS
jgi:short subunit dehydrogenase-like uncharacterized protein